MSDVIGGVVIKIEGDSSDLPKSVDDALRKMKDRFFKGFNTIANWLPDRLTAGLAKSFDKLKRTTDKVWKSTKSGFNNFVSGFKDSNAAASAFTGKMGALGGVARKALDPGIKGIQNFISGFKDSTAAASSFTGVLGTVGGVTRRVLDPGIKSVQNFISGFSDARAAASSFSGVMGSIGGVTRRALNPAIIGVQKVASAIDKGLNSKVFQGFVTGASTAANKVATTMLNGVSGIAGGINRALGSKTFSGFVSGAQSAAKSAGQFITSTMSNTFSSVKSIASGAFVALGAVITANLGGAIARADIINNFPKVMENIGYSADEARDAIQHIADSLDGLPSTTQSIASVTQSLTPLTGSIEKAADVALSMNNALLAGGAAAGLQENAMEQYRQMLARGTVDMMSWKSLQSAMPGQLDQLAKALVGPTAKGMDLYDSLQDGTLSLEDFNDALVQLNKDGIDGLASFEDQARAATGGIGTAFKNMGNRVVSSLTKVIQYFGVDDISVALNNFSSQFGGWADKVIGFIDKVKENFNFDKLNKGIAPLIGLIAGIGSTFLTWIPGIGPHLKLISGPVGFVIGLFIQMWQNSEKLRDVISKAFEKISAAAEGSAPIFEKVSDVIGRIAEVLGDVLASAIEGLMPVVESLVETLGPVFIGAIELLATALEWLSPVIEKLAPAIVAVTVAWKIFNTALMQNPIMRIIGLITALVAGIVWFFTKTETGKAIVKAVWDWIKNAIENVVNWYESTAAPIIETVTEAIGAAWEWLKDAGGKAWDWIKDVVGAVADWFGEHVAPLFESGGETIAAVWENIQEKVQFFRDFLEPVIEWLGTAWESVLDVFDWVGEAWQTLVESFQIVWDEYGQTFLDAMEMAWENAKTVFETVWNTIKIQFELVWNVMKTIVETALAVIKGVIDFVTAVISGDWGAAWEAIKGIFSAVWNGIKSIVSSVFNAVKAQISNILNGIKSVWDNSWETIKNFLSTVWNGMKAAVSAAINAVKTNISNVLNTIKNTWDTAWNNLKNKVNDIWNGIKQGVRNGINAVMDYVRGLKDKILNFFSGAGTWLKDAGKKLISGLTDGIKSAFGSAKEAVSNGLSSLRNLLPFSPAKEGPFSGRGYTMYSGEAMIEDLAKGILREQGALDSAMRKVLESANSKITGVSPLKDIPGKLSVRADGASAVGTTSAGTEINYNDNRTVNNPVAEPDSIEVDKNLQRAAAGVGRLVG